MLHVPHNAPVGELSVCHTVLKERKSPCPIFVRNFADSRQETESTDSSTFGRPTCIESYHVSFRRPLSPDGKGADTILEKDCRAQGCKGNDRAKVSKCSNHVEN